MYAGLDVHKRFCHGTIMNEEGEIVKHNRFSKDSWCLEEFMDGVDDPTIVIEARGTKQYQLAFLLSTPIHKLIVSSKELVNRLQLENDSWVLEIGASSGFFSIEVATCITQDHLELTIIVMCFSVFPCLHKAS